MIKYFFVRFRKIAAVAAIAWISVLGLDGCASVSSAASKPVTGLMEAIPGENESVIIVKRNNYFAGSAAALNILIDGTLFGYVENGKAISFTIPNGSHTIQAVNAYFAFDHSTVLSFSADNKKIYFSAGYDFFGVRILKFNEVALESKPKPSVRTSGAAAGAAGIEGAVSRIADLLLADLPKKSVVAVLSIYARDRNTAAFVQDELEFQLVESRAFTMVNRSSLGAVRDEEDFQSSGEVSDTSAVSLGNKLGASIVITGSVSSSGDTQRLVIKALDVKTAKIITMAREQF